LRDLSRTPASDLPCGLMLVHGNQPETLRELLVGWFARYPLEPLESEVILVHSAGIAQWLKLALAADVGEGAGCGIAAAFSMQLPARFLWQAYRALLGGDAVPEASPFDKPRLIWRLMRLLPQLAGLPVYAPLQRFLDRDDDARKRYQLAERLADVFDQYQVYRADWLAAWAAGADVLIDARGERRPLPDEQRWQGALWRALLADVGVAGADAVRPGRAAVHEAFLQAVARWPQGSRPDGLPRRISVFGVSSLPRQALEALAALARWTQVLICVHNPCAYYWSDIVSDRQLLASTRSRQTRRSDAPQTPSDDLLHLHAHPLLAAWGRQGRDFIALLDEFDSDQARHDYALRFAEIGQRIDLFASNAGATLLQQLQDDILALRPLPETRTHWPPVDGVRDGSIRFHVAHGAQREVEILHDQLLAAFDADATLRPRDVIVMVPDIDAYAPHIRAVFGLVDRHDARYIPFSLADQKRRSGDPLALAIETLLGLPQSRLTVSDLADLLDVAALRRRFAIAEDDLPLLRRWIDGANIRWGLHAEQRASLGLPMHEAGGQAPNSWLFGLRRMLLGYAVGAGAEAWHDIEPYDEIGGLDAALLGPLTALVERLDAAWRTLRGSATPRDWCATLRALLADFFAADDERDAYLLQQLDAALQEWLEMCDEADLSSPLPLSVVADHWLARLDEGGLAQRFFGGAVTFATLMPMRAIPFRRVCLLGMNDGDYPRARVPMDFDLMGNDYRPGDRSRREDDRYLFLEALLSARDHLHISWVGRSITDNTERPASVLVGQLRDHLAAGWRLAGTSEDSPADVRGEALLAALTVEHRLQPFARAYFVPDEDARLFSYAREWCAAVGEGTDGANGETAAGDAVLPPVVRDEPLALRELADFLKSPVKAFFRQRLGVSFDGENGDGGVAAAVDHEPFEVDALGQWALRNELIAALRETPAGEESAVLAAGLARFRRRGELPAGAFGEALAQALAEPLPDLLARYRAGLARWPVAASDGAQGAESGEALRFAVVGEDGVTIEIADWIDGVRLNAAGERGRVFIEPGALVRNRQYRGERLVAHWLAHLAAHVAGGALTTLVVSVAGDVELAPLPVERARALLADGLLAWQQGMRRPLPLAVRTAWAWLRACPAAADGEAPQAAQRAAALVAARKAYEGGYDDDGEVGHCAYLRRAYPDFAALSDARAPAGEGCAAREERAQSAFVRLAERLLRPLYEAVSAASPKVDAAQAADEQRVAPRITRGEA
jgi:exodeoxyribonuclease V gamma subunit